MHENYYFFYLKSLIFRLFKVLIVKTLFLLLDVQTSKQTNYHIYNTSNISVTIQIS